VLAVDVGQVNCQLSEQNGGGGSVAYKASRLAAGLDLTLD